MKTFPEILEEANKAVPKISPEEAKSLQDEGALIIDIREAEELKVSGKVKGAYHIPRGLLEFQTELVNLLVPCPSKLNIFKMPLNQ